MTYKIGREDTQWCQHTWGTCFSEVLSEVTQPPQPCRIRLPRSRRDSTAAQSRHASAVDLIVDRGNA
jgi:hypothetical protein